MHVLCTVPKELVITRLRVVVPGGMLENGMAEVVTPQSLGNGGAQTSHYSFVLCGTNRLATHNASDGVSGTARSCAATSERWCLKQAYPAR